VFFNAGAPGLYTVAISAFPATSLSNFTGGNVVIDTRVNGQGTVVPEPASAVLATLGLVGVLATAARPRRARVG
jgi:hypothetical protein